MKLKSILFIFCFISQHLHSMLLDSSIDPAQIKEQRKHEAKEQKKSISSISSQLVDFKYEQEPLKDLLNHYAQKLNLNILYPETETVTATISFNAGRKITMTEAWNFVTMILEQAGYTLVMRGTNTYVLMTNTKTYQEPLPLYIGVDFEQLPDTMQRIRYVYYFNNIQVAKQEAELNVILKNILPTTDIANQLIFDKNSNSMILTTRADLIRTVMQLISVLDETGFQQAVELLKLEHAHAKDIVDLFKSVLSGGADAAKKPSGFVSLATGQRAKYFSENVRVENLDPNNIRQLNTIIIMGKMHDIDEIKKFIKKYLDIAQETGKSFFHVIDLQWVQATHLVGVLKNLIQSGGSSGTGQSTSTINSSLSFDPHIQIVNETITTGNPANASTVQNSSGATDGAGTTASNTIQRGANKLIIACANRDWQRIDNLIKQIDVPQKQVLIEALVVDLNLSWIKQLGSQIRTRGITPSIFPKNMQAQAGLLDNNVIQYMTDPDYYSLIGDLSDILNPDWPPSSGTDVSQPQTSTTIPQGSTGGANLAKAPPGSTIMMLSGGKSVTNGVWAFFQLLSQHTSSKIFTRPVILVSNNYTATVTSSLTKNLAGAVTQGTNPTVNYTQVTAPVTINFTPLISDNNTVNLAVTLNLTTYSAPDNASSGDQSIRLITTNVSMNNGDVLILGGLTQEQTQVSKSSIPFFESIPIIGNLFASRSKNATKNQLYILIRVTVTTPRAQGGIGKMTETASNFIVDQLAESENTFANLKDPITRWFFNSDRDEVTSEFFEEKISDLGKIDYGKSEIDFKTSHTGQHILNSDRKPGNMTIGWFSDSKSNNPYASQAVTNSNKDMDKLSALLKNSENPFTARVQL